MYLTYSMSNRELKIPRFDRLWKHFRHLFSYLTLILLTWTIWRAPTNASKWRMGFNPYPANVKNMASSYQC